MENVVKCTFLFPSRVKYTKDKDRYVYSQVIWKYLLDSWSPQDTPGLIRQLTANQRHLVGSHCSGSMFPGNLLPGLSGAVPPTSLFSSLQGITLLVIFILLVKVAVSCLRISNQTSKIPEDQGNFPWLFQGFLLRFFMQQVANCFLNYWKSQDIWID